MWTEELQKQTKEHFVKLPIARMKHFGDLRFGTGALKDGKYIIIEDNVDEKYEYDTIEELINDGWAID